MGDGAEGFTDVGGVGYVALGGEKGSADACCVGGVADVRVCGFWSSGQEVRLALLREYDNEEFEREKSRRW